MGDKRCNCFVGAFEKHKVSECKYKGKKGTLPHPKPATKPNAVDIAFKKFGADIKAAFEPPTRKARRVPLPADGDQPSEPSPSSDQQDPVHEAPPQSPTEPSTTVPPSMYDYGHRPRESSVSISSSDSDDFSSFFSYGDIPRGPNAPHVSREETAENINHTTEEWEDYSHLLYEDGDETDTCLPKNVSEEWEDYQALIDSSHTPPNVHTAAMPEEVPNNDNNAPCSELDAGCLFLHSISLNVPQPSNGPIFLVPAPPPVHLTEEERQAIIEAALGPPLLPEDDDDTISELGHTTVQEEDSVVDNGIITSRAEQAELLRLRAVVDMYRNNSRLTDLLR